MREIKFRGIKKYHFACDEDRPKTMLYGTGLVQDSVNTWLIDNPSRKSLALGMAKTIIEPETVGQFTGLKDGNGQEIFEGDILSYSSWWDDSIYIHTVVFKNAEFAVEPYPRNESCGREGLKYIAKQDDPDDYKAIIIGNIHENPELLK